MLLKGVPRSQELRGKRATNDDSFTALETATIVMLALLYLAFVRQTSTVAQPSRIPNQVTRCRVVGLPGCILIAGVQYFGVGERCFEVVSSSS